jgi:hypothetical protein
MKIGNNSQRTNPGSNLEVNLGTKSLRVTVMSRGRDTGANMSANT